VSVGARVDTRPQAGGEDSSSPAPLPECRRWSQPETYTQTGFKPFYEAVARHAGQGALDLLSAYWTLGDLDKLTGLLEAAGLRIGSTRTRTDAIRAPSIDQYVTTEIESTPLVERISDEVFQRIRADERTPARSL
jgi:hypothetical protein